MKRKTNDAPAGQASVWRASIFAVIGAALLILLVQPAFRMSTYLAALDAYSASIRLEDPIAAKENLKRLQAAQAKTEGWSPLGIVLRRAYLADPRLVDASYYSVVGNHQEVIDRLKGVETSWAYHLRGIALFRQQQIRYAAGQKRQALETTLRDVAPLFEKALELGRLPNWEDAYNYDLTSNPASAEEALKGNKRPQRARLGIPAEGAPDKGDEPDRQREGGKGPRERRW